jgi:hypothetical protein
LTIRPSTRHGGAAAIAAPETFQFAGTRASSHAGEGPVVAAKASDKAKNPMFMRQQLSKAV